MKKIIISVSNDLVIDQRVAKVCHSLSQERYQIELIGRLKKDKTTLYRNYSTKRFRMLFHKTALFYFEFNIRLFFYLLFSKKDILYANDADTLIPNYLVSKLQNKPLVFDSHELFSEIPEVINRPLVKKVWRGIENWIIPKLKHVITVSSGIKNHYKELYNIDATVIKNVPVSTKIKPGKFPFSIKNKKVILYQGAVNLGRGLELMIETMHLLPDYIFVIIGDGDILDSLEQKVLMLNLENQVKFLGRVSPKELKGYTPLADIGISLEEDLGLNYRYALPNKLFDYIQAEIPVIVSDLPEMKSLVIKYEVGHVLSERSSTCLTNLIVSLQLQNKKFHLQEAKQFLNWQNEESKLISLIRQFD